MAAEKYSLEESRKLAVLMARIWSDPELAASYRHAPEAVLSGAGVDLKGRPVPEIPERPSAIGEVGTGQIAARGCWSSLSTVSCPCTACTSSCASVDAAGALDGHVAAMIKLAEDPAGRESARRMTASWKISGGNN